MRDLNRVVTFLMRQVIPASESVLLGRLKAFYETIFYTPPERQARRDWVALSTILHEELGPAAGVDWKERVARIMRDDEKIPDDFKELEGL